MNDVIFSGIQQIGIGVKDVHKSWKWYRENLGFDVPIFEERATAELMLPYTGGEPRDRHAVLALNMKGGGGLEVWQYVGRVPEKAQFDIRYGDLGINCVKVKSDDIEAAFKLHRKRGLNVLTELTEMPDGRKHYFLADPDGNKFELVESDIAFSKPDFPSGGIIGATMGCSDIDKSISFYEQVLGYDEIVYRTDGLQEDLKGLATDAVQGERVLLRRTKPVEGAFSRLLGNTEIELFKASDFQGRKIYEDRFWGDIGFIHLCYDISNMDALREHCAENGAAFTVDSDPTFDMGEAAGHFSYIEDPDGALIEFVETHRIPIMKKIGWYLNLTKRNPRKALPSWMLKMLSLNRVRN